MTHRDAWPLLDDFLDGTLTAGQRWAVAAHLDDCAACRKQLAMQARLRGRVRDHLAAAEPPPGLHDRLQSALAKARPAPPPLPAIRPPVTTLRVAALLGPALVAFWLLAQVTAPAAVPTLDIPAELAAAHALFAHDESLLDVAGDAPLVTAWFRNEVGLDISAPDIEGYELLGGRLTVLGGKPVAQLVYESEPGEEYLSLLRFRDPSPGADGAVREMVAQRGTIATCIWPRGDDLTALVAEQPVAELQRLAAELVKPNSSGADRDY